MARIECSSTTRQKRYATACQAPNPSWHKMVEYHYLYTLHWQKIILQHCAHFGGYSAMVQLYIADMTLFMCHKVSWIWMELQKLGRRWVEEAAASEQEGGCGDEELWPLCVNNVSLSFLMQKQSAHLLHFSYTPFACDYWYPKGKRTYQPAHWKATHWGIKCGGLLEPPNQLHQPTSTRKIIPFSNRSFGPHRGIIGIMCWQWFSRHPLPSMKTPLVLPPAEELTFQASHWEPVAFQGNWERTQKRT